MAGSNLRPCKGCGVEIGTNAAVCPHCGQRKFMTLGGLVMIAILLVVAILVSVYNKV